MSWRLDHNTPPGVVVFEFTQRSQAPKPAVSLRAHDALARDHTNSNLTTARAGQVDVRLPNCCGRVGALASPPYS